MFEDWWYRNGYRPIVIWFSIVKRWAITVEVDNLYRVVIRLLKTERRRYVTHVQDLMMQVREETTASAHYSCSKVKRQTGIKCQGSDQKIEQMSCEGK